MSPSNPALNIVFMGTPEIARESLSYIAELEKLNIIGLKSVYTKPPVWNNKKKEFTISPVDKLARELGISVRTPRSLKNNVEEIGFLKSLNLDLIIVTAFGLILPGEVLNIPKYGVLNLHPSLLPDLRGPSPIQFTILNKLKFGGVSIMAMDVGVDTGPIIAQQRLEIGKNEYYGSLYKRLSLAGALLLVDVIKTIFELRINCERCGIPQYQVKSERAERFFLTGLIEPEDMKVDFSVDEPLDIYAKIRAFSDLGGAFFIFKNKKIKISEARLIVHGEYNNNYNDLKKFGEGLSLEPLVFDYEEYADYFPENLKSGINALPEELRNIIDIPVPGFIIIANKTGLLVSTVKKRVYIQLIKLKPEGRNVMDYGDFINGFRIKQGEKCS